MQTDVFRRGARSPRLVELAGTDRPVPPPQDGQTIVARGGEKVYAYETVDGGRAQGFELRPGDRAQFVCAALPSSLVEWRIARAPSHSRE